MTTPTDIVLANLTVPPVRGNVSPLISTKPEHRDGSRPADDPDPQPTQGLIWQSNIDNEPPWHSGLSENDLGYPTGEPDRIQRATTHTFPQTFTSCYQDSYFGESQGNPGGIEAITFLEPGTGRNGSKAIRMARESYDPTGDGRYFASDSTLAKVLSEEEERSALYIEFWIKFPENWDTTPNQQSKIFRVSSWNRSGSEFQAFTGGNLGPIFVYDWTASSYGLRNGMYFRGGPHGQNYSMIGRIDDLPYQMSAGSLGDLPLNWTNHQVGAKKDGTSPQVPDRVNGGYILDNPGQIVTHAQVVGTAWNKFAFWLQMNSAPGIRDGVVRQWFNDEEIFYNEKVEWIPAGNYAMPKWNLVAVGGNDNFNVYPNSEKHQESYLIDGNGIVVRDSIPEDLL